MKAQAPAQIGRIIAVAILAAGAAMFGYAIIDLRNQNDMRAAAAITAGFSSADEMEKARGAGFSTPDSWQVETQRLADEGAAMKARAAKLKADNDALEKVENAKFQEGVNFALVLRSSMKNPAAFNLEQSLRMNDGTWCYTYRSTNSFNAVIPGYAVFATTGVASTGDAKFDRLWSKHCAGKSGDNFKSISYALKNFAKP